MVDRYDDTLMIGDDDMGLWFDRLGETIRHGDFNVVVVALTQRFSGWEVGMMRTGPPFAGELEA